MYKVFDTLEEYNQFTDNGTNLTSGAIYYIKEDGSTHFQTNNIDGEEKVYDMIDGIPEGYIIPSGNISITENGENINVNEYATASVNVPIPDEYIVPSGNKEITQNGTNIDIAQYATASVNVDTPAKDYIVEGAVYDPTETYSGEFKCIKHITSVTIPSGFTSIGSQAFYQCKSLSTVTIPNSVTSIGGSAFHNCTSLSTVTIPNSVTSIGSGAFQNCSKLTSIEIPNSVTSIGNYVFQGCSGLTSVTIQATTPPTLGGTTVFNYTNNCPIYVPAKSVDAYKAATNWSSLSDRIQPIAVTE